MGMLRSHDLFKFFKENEVVYLVFKVSEEIDFLNV